MQNTSTVKINSHDIIKSIDNLEYLEHNNLDLRLPEDKSFLKYENDVVIKDYDEFIKRSDYTKAIRYLKDNDIDETLLHKHILIIYDYLNSNDKINLETLKKVIINLETYRNSITDNTELIDKARQYDEPITINDNQEIGHLRCVIKMTEYTPISGGNISELNKIPDLFLNKRSLLVLRNNDNKCFLH